MTARPAARPLPRLLGALAVLLAGLVLPVSPAGASCAVDVVAALRDDPEVAFVGVDRRRVSDGDRLIVRFRVEQVHRGEVRRTQDVVVPDDRTSAGGADWSPGDRVLVLGERTEAGVVATNQCFAAPEGSAEYRSALRQLGERSEPLAGLDRVEPDGLSHRDLRWFKLAIGVVGLSAMGFLAVRWLRDRRA